MAFSVEIYGKMRRLRPHDVSQVPVEGALQQGRELHLRAREEGVAPSASASEWLKVNGIL